MSTCPRPECNGLLQPIDIPEKCAWNLGFVCRTCSREFYKKFVNDISKEVTKSLQLILDDKNDNESLRGEEEVSTS